MEVLLWLLVALFVVAIVLGVGVVARRRQRRGGVIATPARQTGPRDGDR